LLTAAAACGLLSLPHFVRAQAADSGTYLNNKAPWIGHETEIETALKNVEIVSCKATGEGVTHPQHCQVPPGGLFQSLAFKDIPPGPKDGAMESYKSEIAAYEIDKMLHLGMVPPTVEKQVKKTKGAAVYWIEGTKNFNDLGAKNGGAPTPPDPAKQAYWNIQLTRAKMFDCLVDNQDPNLGNWLTNSDWTLFIIDHSRALHGDTTCVHDKTINHIDKELWERMQALTLADLTTHLSPWMDKSDIKAVITSRDNLGKKIDALVKKNGEANVFIKAGG